MKTVMYQIPVSPVEISKKSDEQPDTAMAQKLADINHQAYHMANRCASLLLSHFYPVVHVSVQQLIDGYNAVRQQEKIIETFYKTRSNSADDAFAKETAIQDKRMALKQWETSIAESSVFKETQQVAVKEFAHMPGPLAAALLHKVVTDILHTFMNKNAVQSFAASFAFYRHEMHLPLCLDNKMIKWEQNQNSKDAYYLHWFNGIKLKTNFSDRDLRLPALLQQLYFTNGQPVLHGRKPHGHIAPTLKQSGTKWSVHIPVLEDVQPVTAEKEQPLTVVFGFVYPIAYAFGTNHARALPFDTAAYITNQLHKFGKRMNDAADQPEQQEKIKTAQQKLMKRLTNKAAAAIVLLARKGQKNYIYIEPMPLQNQPSKPGYMTTGNLPGFNTRFFQNVEGWNFALFYETLRQQAAVYGITVKETRQPQWEDLKLHVRNFKRVKGNSFQVDNNEPFLIANQYTTKDEGHEKAGYLTFNFGGKDLDNYVENTNGGFVLYESPDKTRHKGYDYKYRIQIDVNLAMNLSLFP